MKAGNLHINTRIQGDDGFYMTKLIQVKDKESFQKLMEKLKVEDVAPTQVHDDRFVQRKFASYLKGFCAEGFCVATRTLMPVEEDNYKDKAEVYVGFRSKKDLFKFNIRFGAIRVRWWRSSTPFRVVTTTEDPFIPSKAGEKWNREDPHGYIRP